MGETLSWLSSRGSTLKEQDSAGLVYFSETEPIARSKEKNLIFDYLSLPVQQSAKNLPWPEYLSNITIRLSGLDLSGYPLLNEGRQVLNGDVIEISKENMETMKESTYALPYKDKDLDQFLAPTAFVQSDHHTIIYNAEKFAAIEKNAFRLARFLTSNLYLTMTKMPFSQVPVSMDVFDEVAGESNEHTVLFTAFTRAAGLPTRMVGGLVYRKGYFYYHTWPEVWLKQWVPADPTMGQFPADVTHIRLIEGDIDKLASLGEIIGKIKIEILIDIMGEL
jgi:transglutaminase-like putative cysteine protease